MAAVSVDNCRNLASDFLLGKQIAGKFHSLFQLQEEKAKKPEKKPKKRSKKTKDKQNTQLEKISECLDVQPPVLDLHGNPSAFSVFSNVRRTVQEAETKRAAQLYLQSLHHKQQDEESDEESAENRDAALFKLPKIVGIGLCGVFELIQETKLTHPALCIRALKALLDMIQGQQPEGLKNEPPDVIDSLYSLLMDLSSSASQVQSTSTQDSLANHTLTALACACLTSLVVSRGDTGKYLSALTALLMSPPSMVSQKVNVPHILTSLQKSVHAVLLGKTILPDWFSSGVKEAAKTSVLKVQPIDTGEGHSSALASDGQYLYIHNSQGLHKVGSGYGGTIRGHSYAHNPNFHLKEQGWLAYAQRKLFYRSLSSVANTLSVIDRDTLQDICEFEVEGEGYGPNVMFSDGENIGHIASAKDDSFVVRSFSPVANPMVLVNELPLKLARKCLDAFGTAPFDQEVEIHSLTTGFDEEPVYITSGKEFAFIRTATGKVLYTGKSQALGIKQGGPSQGKWAELPVTKAPKVTSCAVGHDGQHALLLSDDGSVFFVGTARRGEDGESGASKGRRQPKPVKAKKMSKLDNKGVAMVTCNSGTSAAVTKDGQLYMFGKDNSFCDSSTGLVTELRDIQAVSVSLGKAHAVVLTSKGHIYTFGVNNKGQCGRDFVAGATREMSTVVTMADEEEDKEEDDVICPQGKHKWKHDQCMICVACGECSGYGGACVNAVGSGKNSRTAGQPCGCGSGDSGCSECGVCRVCAGEALDPEEEEEGADGGLLEIFAKSRNVIPLDLIIGRHGARNLDQLSKKLEDRKQKVARVRSVGKNKDESGDRAEPEPDHVKMSSLPPGKVDVGSGDVSVIQVACGLQHTVLLLENGEVYTFGSNHYGQLGLGDTTVRGVPTRVPVRASITQVAAGSHHTVLLSNNGQVYTCGSHKEGQLGRPSPQEEQVKEKRGTWFAVPTLVVGIGSKHGRRATWIGASGSQTYLRIDESLINAHTLSRSSIVANRSSLGLIPMTESGSNMKCLMISRVDGSCKNFTDQSQTSLYNQSVCIDPLYDVLWSYAPVRGQISCYSVFKPESCDLKTAVPTLFDISSPVLMVPTATGHDSTRSHVALHMLGCLDTLTSAQQLGVAVFEEEKEKQPSSKVYSKEDFSTVNRFESHGGGWGYSGQSIEAIRFMADCDVLLGGFGLFGGRGEYFGKIKLFELGPDGGENEIDGEMVAETEEMPYECGAREKFSMLFEEPVLLQATHWYIAWARISGPSSDCGSNGQAMVTTEDQVVFKFKSSKKSNNGTDVNAGQLPQLLYRLPSNDTSSSSRKTEQTEPAHILSRDFCRTVTPECFESLLKLLNWSWNTFCAALHDVRELRGLGLTAAMLDLERLVYISTSSLRLIRVYINEVYPNQGVHKKTPPETTKLAECVGDTRSLLKKILADSHRQVQLSPSTTTRLDSQANQVEGFTEPLFQNLDNIPPEAAFQSLAKSIVQECHATFTACFHAFFPTASLKWACLCELLGLLEPYQSNVEGLSCLLAAVMEALCHPTVKLSTIMPINCEHQAEKFLQSNFSGDDNTSSTSNHGDASQFPLLVSHMMERAECEGMGWGQWSFREVLDKLLSIVVLPVRQAMHKEKPTYSQQLVTNTCSLLAAVVSELGALATGSDMEISPPSRPLLSSPNRFTRTSSSAYWNTGQGSPDAVCFSIDRAGVLIAGVGLYGGTGQYDYEIDLLDEIGDGTSEHSHTGRWATLQTAKGTYGPEDCINDLVEIKFDRPVPIKENKKYALRLRNRGPRTLNGDTGLNKVKCPDGTTFSFFACSLSSNGTNHTRGQIPQILYYSSPQEGENSVQNSRILAEYQARKNVITVTSAVFKMATDLLQRAQGLSESELQETVGKAEMFTTLLPLVVAYVAPVVSMDPKGAVQSLTLIQDILPSIANLNAQLVGQVAIGSPSNTLSNQNNEEVNNGNSNNGNGNYGSIKESNTTSQHYAIVESDHPYKAATVANYKVTFPERVKWMVLEFDQQCSTAQNEDSLRLYIPARSRKSKFRFNSGSSTNDQEESADKQTNWWPVLSKFSGRDNWPNMGVILPGNQVCFSLETASDYVKDDKASAYGFRCLVVGYEWAPAVADGLAHLEKEVTYLGGMCAASLMRKDIVLPPTSTDTGDEDYDTIEEGAQQVFNSHPTLLGKGFALSQPVSINQALEGNLPFCWTSNERTFLKDFVNCTAGTSGGRLAAWLQPESYLDTNQCDIVYSREDLKCSWPAVIVLQTKDQYGKLVSVPNLKVEVKAVPIIKDTMERKKRSSRVDADSSLVFGGHPPPKLDTPYQVTLKDKKDAFHAICMMKAYEKYSFEELRYCAPVVRRPSENMLVRANNDGTYSCNWTPGSTGWYNIHITLDGFEVGDVFKVEVKDPPQGITPPSQNKTQRPGHQPNRMRKFVGKSSAGLRVRIHPSLQSEMVGVIKPEGIITFIDELHNDDGIWVRLNQESVDKWCTPPTNGICEAWALQYNQHLGRTLLVPVEEPKSILDEIIKVSLRRAPETSREQPSVKHKGGPGNYQVVKCGSSGHNIRSRPSLKASPIGMVSHGNQVVVTDDQTNAEGVWVRLEDESKEAYCHDLDGEAWCLARNHDGIVYIQHESEVTEEQPHVAAAKGFDFSAAQHTSASGFASFSPSQVPAFGAAGIEDTPGASPFRFGQEGDTADPPKPGSIPTFGLPPKPDKTRHIAHREKSRVMSGSRGSSRESSPHQGSSRSSPRPASPLVAAAVAVGDGLGGGVPPRPPERRESLSKEFSKDLANISSDIPPELQGVSVKDLIKALGQFKIDKRLPIKISSLEKNIDLASDLKHISVKDIIRILGESRVNGNGVTPPRTPPGTPKKSLSRSGSPKPTSSKGHGVTGSPRGGSPLLSRRDLACASGIPTLSPRPTPPVTPPGTPTLARRLSENRDFITPPQTPPRSSPRLIDRKPQSPQRSLSYSPQRSASPLAGSPHPASPVLLTPSRGGAAQTPADTSAKGLFSIGAGTPKDESRISPKSGKKDRGKALRSKRDRAVSPSSTKDKGGGHSKSGSRSGSLRKAVKEAMSPSVAQCMRAVFAAFMWHEGIVHDAMACASFLKFHPNLVKELPKSRRGGEEGSDSLKSNRSGKKTTTPGSTPSSSLKKEHSRNSSISSMSLSEGSSNINVTPTSTPSDSLKSRHSRQGSNASVTNFNMNEAMKEMAEASPSKLRSKASHQKEEKEVVAKGDGCSDLPPTLEYLVYFWEELSMATMKVVLQNMISPSPAAATMAKVSRKAEKKEKERKEEKRQRKKREGKYMQLGGLMVRANMIGGAADGPFGVADRIERVDRGGGAGGGDRETMCELCGNSFPHPVTYHMKEAHPGCGSHAGGQGYNSGGNFCGGWAGNCGDGGAGGSTWYLMCDRCRDKYLKEKKQTQKDKLKKSKKKSVTSFKQPNPSAQVTEPHLVMKNNAMFLLDLASAAGFTLPVSHQATSPAVMKRRSVRLDSSLPSVTEDLHISQNAFPLSHFMYLYLRGAQASDSAFAEDVLISDEKVQRPLNPGHSDLSRPGDRSPVITRRSLSNEVDTSPQLPLTSRSAEASPIDGPTGDKSPAGRVIFQRSVSEYVHPIHALNEEEDGLDANYRVNTRRRNNSGGPGDGAASLLKHPSQAMETLMKSAERAGSLKRDQVDKSFNRPVLAFVTQRHDLESLQVAMRQALRKASCRVYALQAFNWLLRSITQPTCIHDLLWHFVGALTPPPPEQEEEEDEGEKKKEPEPVQDKEILCEHPLSDIAVAGEAVFPLPKAFHGFLQTISDVMMFLPPGSSLQQMAVRCWCLRFKASDHTFLHKCQVFSNISKILSKSDEGWGLNTIARERKQHGTHIQCMKDLTSSVEMKASSRAAMIASLTDNSTETFWESGDEDRNKNKSITVTCPQAVTARLISAHIDNTRDMGNKVTSIVFSAGKNTEDLKKIKQSDIETRFTGWVTCSLETSDHDNIPTVLRLELRGPDNNLRLRQVKVLGDGEGGERLDLGPPANALVMQQQNCEAETLRVFRLLTSQVFGKLISGSPPTPPSETETMESSYEDVDLREHMVGILFSRSKLTHLQKQVCSHIVQAIRKEALRVREEWETTVAAGGDATPHETTDGDAYCFELLSMVLALSGSSVGRLYLSQQHSLMQDLLTLLHTASPRVQRQVTSLLRRVLPEVAPQTLANLLGVPSLPPPDFNLSRESDHSPDPYDFRRMGILDVFLACIAKALTMQVKTKAKGFGKSGTNTYSIGECVDSSSDLGSRWWLRGRSSHKLASSIVDLLKDLAAGKLSDTWATVTKSAVAENILSLTRLDESQRTPAECVKTPTLWLALASLCVLNQEHVERLSSGHYQTCTTPTSQQQPADTKTDEAKPRPTCDNHDDSETLAIIHCEECGNLCSDCDRFLHLHRRTRSHQRQVFKEEEESIKVDLHEGIGRTKLFWIMCLADSKTNKAMVEFREGAKGGGSGVGGTCRFCGSSGAAGMLSLGNVCTDPDCQEFARSACSRTHPCGHQCGGIKDEDPCLPCLHGCKTSDGESLKQDTDDMCMICFTEALSAAPAIQCFYPTARKGCQGIIFTHGIRMGRRAAGRSLPTCISETLTCGHVFHKHCCVTVLDRRWVGPRITFGFSLCPICKSQISHTVLHDLLTPIQALYEDVRRKALMRLEYEGLHKSEAITTEGTHFHKDPTGFAMERYAYYVCFKCKKAYYGGEARCEEQAGGGEDYDPSELVCGACSDVSRAQMCPKHGTDFLEYKCRYCCSVAVFFCFGTTHFCNACHDDFQRVTNIPKSSLPRCPAGPKASQLEGEECPLHVKHPPTGEEFALGCGVCRNAHTF